MFYRVKAIRNNTKPPVWRRALVPSNITFSQLAVILERILEMPFLDTYMFESYSLKVRFAEYRDGKKLPSDYYHTAYDAAENYINEYFDSGKSISFFIPEAGERIPRYRLEIEKSIDRPSLRDRSSGEAVEVRSPLILKEVSAENDLYFSNPSKINEVMRKDYLLFEGMPSYDDYFGINDRLKNGKGILYSNDPTSRKNHVARSSESYIRELVDNMDFMIQNHSGGGQTFKEKTLSAMAYVKSPEEQHSKSGKPSTQHSLEDFLSDNTYKELMEAAEEIDYQTTEKDKNKLAKKLAKQYLLPETMKQQLFWAKDEELDTFEDAVKKRDTFFKAPDWDKYDNIYGLGYYIAYSDDFVGVTGDIADTYEIIKKSGYRSLHKQVRWLRDCLGYVGMFYLVMPLKQVYRIFKQKEGMDIGFEAFKKLFDEIPQHFSICSLHGDKVVGRNFLEDGSYKKIEKKMLDIGYYIAPVSSIEAYAKDKYPSDEPHYLKLFKYFTGNLRWSKKKATEMCITAERSFSFDGDVPEYLELLHDEGVSEAVYDGSDLLKLVIDVYNNTRMVFSHGYTPEELFHLYPQFVQNISPAGETVMPVMEPVLSYGKDILKVRGANADIGLYPSKPSIAFKTEVKNEKETSIVKKIYPNDPCPCGSGKKYKKCCGKG